MMAGVFGVRAIAAAAGVDSREVVALLRTGGDMRRLGWLGWRAQARLLEERRSSGELDLTETLSLCRACLVGDPSRSRGQTAKTPFPSCKGSWYLRQSNSAHT